MLVRTGLVLVCFVLAGCGAAPSARQAGAPPAAGTPADGYAQPQAASPLPPTQAAAPSQPDPGLVATSVAATVAANPQSAATALPAVATQASGAATAAVPITGALTLLPLEQLLDYSLADSSGVIIGEVKDLVIDLKPPADQAAAPYLAVSSHVNDDWLFLIPWQFIQIHPDQGLVLLSVPASQLQTAPGFHEDAWPASLPAEWRAGLLRFWQNPGQAAAMPGLPAPGAAPARDILRAKELFDFDIVDGRYFALGEIKDIAIDWAASQPGAGVEAARFGYVIMERDEALGPGAEYIPVPWKRLQLNLPQEIAVINMPPQTLRGAPAFAELAWPNLYSEPWASDLNRFWKP